ncbi:hypothetical protein FACS189418_3040 [Clostridia bacterium]|nr:hypothetical protein FACS189418_3040 [Clostridia bacterium]
MDYIKVVLEEIKNLPNSKISSSIFADYIKCMSDWMLLMDEVWKIHENDERKDFTLEECKAYNQKLFADVLPENYGSSYTNPAYCAKCFKEEYAALLAFISRELRGMIVFAYEQRDEERDEAIQLFLDFLTLVKENEEPSVESVRSLIEEYIERIAERALHYRVQELVDPGLSFLKDIVLQSDLEDLRYLYQYGEYISWVELALAEFMNRLPEDKVELMASVYVEGYRKGFELANINLAKKKTVVVLYPIGFERMVRIAIHKFRELGLEAILYRPSPYSINQSGKTRRGICSTPFNIQYEHDHRYDEFIYFQEEFAENKLRLLEQSFMLYAPYAKYQAGPAVIESFGRENEEPSNCPFLCEPSEEQKKWEVSYKNRYGQMVNQYIPGDERSFTIIAFPSPEIGKQFPEIFEEIIRINTLDYGKYQKIQQILIDALDQAEFVQILGKQGNDTDLTVALHALEHPDKQSNFENCVADVNIPVGEVFTTPKLKGTKGTLAISQVYIRDIQFQNLKVTFEDGMVTHYQCENFSDVEENRKLIEDNLLFHHPTLPMGEFAIGTNTLAYVTAKKYDIFDRLPILIAEKMGPHFAIGDSCYTWTEDNKTYNANGKQIVAKDNECSIRRKTNLDEAYFHCHTDLTLPYHELGSVTAILSDKSKIPIISDGKFVLVGTEELNEALERTV